jgi:hypothetical protein
MPGKGEEVLNPEDSVEETEGTSDPTQSEKSSEEEDLDYKALYEASEVKNKQLLNDSRGREGNRNRTQDLEDRMFRMEASVEVNARAATHILDKLTREDDEFAEEVRKSNQEVKEKSQVAGAESRKTAVMNDILGIVQIESDDEDTSPTVLIPKDDQEKLSKYWGLAVQESERTGSDAPLYRVHMEASRMVLQAEQAKNRKALVDERTKSKSETKKALEKAGITDQDTGPARSGAGSERKRGTALIEEAISEGSPFFPGARKPSV